MNLGQFIFHQKKLIFETFMDDFLNSQSPLFDSRSFQKLKLLWLWSALENFSWVIRTCWSHVACFPGIAAYNARQIISLRHIVAERRSIIPKSICDWFWGVPKKEPSFRPLVKCPDQQSRCPRSRCHNFSKNHPNNMIQSALEPPCV